MKNLYLFLSYELISFIKHLQFRRQLQSHSNDTLHQRMSIWKIKKTKDGLLVKPWIASDIIFHRKSSSEGRNIIHLWRGKHHTTANSDAEGKPKWSIKHSGYDDHKTIATSYYIVKIIYYIMRTSSPITGKAGSSCHGSHCYKTLLPGNLN